MTANEKRVLGYVLERINGEVARCRSNGSDCAICYKLCGGHLPCNEKNHPERYTEDLFRHIRSLDHREQVNLP